MIIRAVFVGCVMVFTCLIVYLWYPFSTRETIIALGISMLVGACIAGIQALLLKHRLKSLKYAPSEPFQHQYDSLIRQCGGDPSTIILRYAYTREHIGIASDRTIILDPIVLPIEDPQAAAVVDIFTQHIQAKLSPTQHDRLNAVKSVTNPAVARFIVKHELAHILQHHHTKALIQIFIITSAVIYASLVTATALNEANGVTVALMCGLVGGLTHFLASLLANVTWRFRAEIDADEFAARCSSPEDIQAAATFFAAHQDIIEQHPDKWNPLYRLPNELKSGHPHGTYRASYLRRFAAAK